MKSETACFDYSKIRSHSLSIFWLFRIFQWQTLQLNLKSFLNENKPVIIFLTRQNTMDKRRERIILHICRNACSYIGAPMNEQRSDVWMCKSWIGVIIHRRTPKLCSAPMYDRLDIKCKPLHMTRTPRYSVKFNHPFSSL